MIVSNLVWGNLFIFITSMNFTKEYVLVFFFIITLLGTKLKVKVIAHIYFI